VHYVPLNTLASHRVLLRRFARGKISFAYIERMSNAYEPDGTPGRVNAGILQIGRVIVLTITDWRGIRWSMFSISRRGTSFGDTLAFTFQIMTGFTRSILTGGASLYEM